MVQKANGAKRPTINMIARRAGVSRGTVDRVLNGRPGVKPESRQAVLDAVRDLHYISKRIEKLSALSGAPIRDDCLLGMLIPCYAAPDFEEKIVRGIEEARAALSGANVEIMVEKCETQLVDESLEKLDTLAARGARGIAMTAINIGRVARKIDELAQAGIPVITYNSDIPDSRRVCFVGEDARRSGRIAGNLMSKLLPSPDARALAVVGNRGFEGHSNRLAGFIEAMAEAGVGDSRIQTVETYNDYMTTFERVRDALSEDRALKGVYLANESVAGCVEAITRLNLPGHVACVCHDLSLVSRRMLKSGIIDFAITQDMAQQGCQPLLLLNDMLRSGSEAVRYEAPPAQIVCAENLPG